MFFPVHFFVKGFKCHSLLKFFDHFPSFLLTQARYIDSFLTDFLWWCVTLRSSAFFYLHGCKLKVIVTLIVGVFIFGHCFRVSTLVEVPVISVLKVGEKTRLTRQVS